MKKRTVIAVVTIFIVLLLDQWLKIWVKTHMVLNQSFQLFGQEWFQIYFTENKGMAFGMEIGGKLFLSLFRIIAIIFISVYLSRLIKRQDKPMLIFSIALILAGATGNIIDSMFYGLIFNDSYLVPAQFMPEDGGYAPFLFGKVVDMLYFPLFDGTFPDWVPFWGGQDFLFFRPIFNLADAAISIGVGILIIKQKSFFGSRKKKKALPEENITQQPSAENSGDNAVIENIHD